MTASTIGGLILVLAAVLMYNGRIFQASFCYICADFIWIYLAYLTGEYVGTILVLIGTILNIGVFIKMNKGVFVKNLNTANSVTPVNTNLSKNIL